MSRGMHDALQANFLELSAGKLTWEIVCRPIWNIFHDMRDEDNPLPEVMGRERLKAHLEWLDENHGLFHAPSWEEVATGDFDDFQNVYEWDSWSIFVEDEADLEMLKQLAGPVPGCSVDPVELASNLFDFAETIIVTFHHEGTGYVLRSRWVTDAEAEHGWVAGLTAGSPFDIVGVPQVAGVEECYDLHTDVYAAATDINLKIAEEG